MPSEFSGPLMAHLNDEQPCANSSLLQHFLLELKAHFGLGLPPPPPPLPRRTSPSGRPEPRHEPTPGPAPTRKVLTIVTRQNYNNRSLERIWLNEAQAAAALQRAFGPAG